ncbi:hypothetical protein LCGC14_0856190 [marine sediment metagenome]|uniref:DUF3880 domain-containing protein n=1 Tax=marine sediment metagenome TaxID=412755 RepID=A0A0F9PDS1_9ZZZZ
MRMVFVTNPWASAMIRGEQIAARLLDAVVYQHTDTAYENARENDVCIFVKSFPDYGWPALMEAIKVKKCYLDIVDSVIALRSARSSEIAENMDLGVIAIGKLSHEYISEYLDRDDIILIPEHHCNFESVMRDKRDVFKVGFCGYEGNFHLDPVVVGRALASIGARFIYHINPEDRNVCCRFYASIDISLSFRSQMDPALAKLKNPLKLANAGSFGIPTVAYPEPNYIAEWDGCFAKVENLDDVVRVVKVLMESKAAYENLSGLAYEKSKEYHIKKILPLYKELLV